MSALLRVRLSTLLLELVSCVAMAPIRSGDKGKDGDDLPMSREKAAVVDVARAEEYMDVVGTSTPLRAHAGFDYEGFTFGEAESHAFVQDTGGVVDVSVFPLYKFLSHLHPALTFLV